MSSIRASAGGFLREGHARTLFTSLLYFDVCFAVWVLNGAMAPFISQTFGLTAAQKGLVVSVPVVAGALFRLPLGILSEYVGRKRVAQLNMAIVVLGLAVGYLFVDSFWGVVLVGIPLGVAGASFGVALSLGSGWYPPRLKGLAMGITGAGNSGAVLAMLLAPVLAHEHGWKAVYGFSILPLLLAMALLQCLAKEPPDAQPKPLRAYLQILLDRDAWIFNLIYMVTFGGYIGLTSFLPTLFRDQYGVPHERVGQYAAAIIAVGSLLRLGGGWLSDRIGGLRLLSTLAVVIALATLLAATLPASPLVMLAILVVCFAAMGTGNGAVFQLVPLRFKSSTAVASSLIGEVGALAGGLLPNAMGLGRQMTGSFAPGFLCGAALSIAALVCLAVCSREWVGTWVGKGGKALEEPA